MQTLRWGWIAAALTPLACSPRPPAPPPTPAAGCPAALAALGVRFDPWPAPVAGPCRVEQPVRVHASAIPPASPLATSCDLARSWARFEPEVQAIARRELGQNAVRMLHMGSHACRAMTGNAGRASLHAAARALDLVGFELADGSRVTVLEHWHDRGPRGRFLRAVARAACQRFAMVLTPRSDRFHVDHIHLDLGPFARCDA